MNRPRILLVSGIPASGKSTYCRWLKDKEGWYHCDLDLLTNQPLTVESLVQEAQTRKQPTVIDWGFPPEQVNVVEYLNSLGVEIWWFDGDRDAVRASFMERNKNGGHPATVEDLNKQLAEIEANWCKIVKVFGSHIISSVQNGPQYSDPERIFQAMLKP